MAKTVKRVPKVVASRARANGVPSHRSPTQVNSGTQQSAPVLVPQCPPRLAVASEQHVRHCWRTAGSLRPSHVARNVLTAVSAQERANTIPKLHKAKTVTCGLVKWGRRVWMMLRHAVTRGWQDIGILLGGMG